MTKSDQEIEILKRHCAQLMEHFDSVHVFVTRYSPVEEEGTITVQQGDGNWYARYGQIQAWLLKENAALVRSWKDEDGADEAP